jgi:hypothetical protein
MDMFSAMMSSAALFVIAALIAFATYRRRRHNRVSRWVQDYLLVRYGALPNRLNINWSHDIRLPVLVVFNAPANGIRHSLQFSCGGRAPTWFLLSEMHEVR